MVKLIFLFDSINQKPAIEKNKKTVYKSDIYLLHTSDTIGHNLRKSPVLFNGGLLLGNIDQIYVQFLY